MEPSSIIKSPASSDELPEDAPSVVASASGKAIIIGEHAVVYGARAVALPLSQNRLRLRIAKNLQSGRHDIRFARGHEASSQRVVGVIDECFTALGAKPFPVRVACDSDLPVGAGLGASAALCVAIVRAVAKLVGIETTAKHIATSANSLEKRFHGQPSGLDTMVVAFERPIGFRRGQDPLFLSRRSNAKPIIWRFCLVDTGVRSSTLNMIRQAAPYFRTSTASKLKLFNELADQVIAGLENSCPSLVAEAMIESAGRLSEAGVVTHSMQQLADWIVSCGALAVKPTGAGGGGCLLALLPPDEHRSHEVLHRLTEGLGDSRVHRLEWMG